LRRTGDLAQAREVLEAQRAAGGDPAELATELSELCDLLADDFLAHARVDDALLELEAAQALASSTTRLLRIGELLVHARLPGPARDAALATLRSGVEKERAIALVKSLRLEGLLLSAPELEGCPPLLESVRELLRKGAAAAARRELALAPDALRATAAHAILKAETLVQEGRLDLAMDVLASRGIPPRGLAPEPEVASVGRIGALGWHPNGGCVSPVQAVSVPGRGELHFTGNVGETGQQAARLAYACVKARRAALGLASDLVSARDLHLHFVDTELAKDGPSAGLALALAAASALSDRQVPPRLAATGELTLMGEVRAVGGIHEKLVAAALARFSTVLVPRRNLAEVRALPRSVHERLRILPVDTLFEAARTALEPRQ